VRVLNQTCGCHSFIDIYDNDASRTIWLEPETGAAVGLGKDAIAEGLSSAYRD
jgi:hypothetical protein